MERSFASGDPDDVRRSYRLFGDYLHEAFAGADAPVLSYAETTPVVAAAVPAGATPVLDAGCGPNPAAGLAVAARGPRVVAFDIGLGTVRLALDTAGRAGTPLVGVVGDVERLPFRRDAFGALLCDDTIEHVPDARAAVRELGRVLRPGGIAVVATPNRRGVHVLVRRLRDLRAGTILPASAYYAAASHLREYAPGQLARLLSGSFASVSFRPVGFAGSEGWEPVATRVIGHGPLRRLSKAVVAVAVRASAARTEDVVRSTAHAGRAPEVTVAVSSRGRADLIPRLVRRLEEQDPDGPAFEVVLVDDGSTDGTFTAMRAAAARTTLDLRVVRLARSGGPAAGRNVAWRLGSAPVVAFTDDDCQPEPGWLRAGLAALEPGTVVAGTTIPDPAQVGRRGPFSRTMEVHDVGFVATCNAFYRRSDLEAVDGFDEGYATPGGEDTDLAWRLADRGRRLVHAPQAVVRHDVSPSRLVPALRTAWRWHHIPHVIADHPGRGRAVVWRHRFWRRSHASAVAALVGIVASLWWRRAVLLALPWVHHRLVVEPLAVGVRGRVTSLPGAFAVDAVEVAACVRGSVRHRTVLL